MTNHQYGPKGHVLDAFLEHLKQMTEADWLAVNDARDAASDAKWDAAWYTAGYAVRETTRDTSWYITGVAAGVAAGYFARPAARPAARYAVWEILGADLLRKRGQPFFFLPMFGFADEQAIIKQESAE
jgi:hypothetical protein